VVGYAGAYRLLLSDAVVITMAEPATAPMALTGRGGEAVAEGLPAGEIEHSIRGLVPGIRIVRTVFRPTPLARLDGKRVVFATTAPSSVSGVLRDHLEHQHGCTVVGVSHHLADRPHLRADLEGMGDAEVLLVELKAAAIDVAARVAARRGMEVVFCDNRVVTVGGDASFEELTDSLAAEAERRHRAALIATET
jgi:cyclic 2,3-diphosphoglycerate synthetase